MLALSLARLFMAMSTIGMLGGNLSFKSKRKRLLLFAYFLTKLTGHLPTPVGNFSLGLLQP